MKNRTLHPRSTWFLVGFGTRAILAVVVSLIVVVGRNFEATFLYFLDLPTMMFLALAEVCLPDSWFRMLIGSDPYYLSMNLIGSLLWGGSFMLIPLARDMVCRLRRNTKTNEA